MGREETFFCTEKPFPASSGSMDAARSADRRLIREKRVAAESGSFHWRVWPAGSPVYGVFSGHGELSVYGMADQCETIGTLLCYPLAAYYGYCGRR